MGGVPAGHAGGRLERRAKPSHRPTWGGNDAELTRRYAVELAALSPNVCCRRGSVVRALQRATRNIPIVFAQSIDPVGSGIVVSLARPGGNATGFTQFEYGLSAKWAELLKEIAPP